MLPEINIAGFVSHSLSLAEAGEFVMVARQATLFDAWDDPPSGGIATAAGATRGGTKLAKSNAAKSNAADVNVASVNAGNANVGRANTAAARPVATGVAGRVGRVRSTNRLPTTDRSSVHSVRGDNNRLVGGHSVSSGKTSRSFDESSRSVDEDSDAARPLGTDDADAAAANPSTAQADTLRQLRRLTGCVLGESSGDDAASSSADVVMSSGSREIDDLLPRSGRWRGLATAGINQYVAASGGSVVGSPAGALALAAIRQWMHPSDDQQCQAVAAGLTRTGPVVVVADDEQFFPPAAASMGIPMQRVVWVRPRRRGDAVWAIDQSLRCGSVSAVWAVLDERLDDRDNRRMALAAEEGRTPAFLIRPAAAADHRATFAQVSFRVELLPVPAEVCVAASRWEGRARPVQFDPQNPDAIYRRGKPFRTALPNLNHPILRVTADRVRGRGGGGSTIVQIDDAGRVVNLAPQISQLIESLLQPTSTMTPIDATGHHESVSATPVPAAAMHLASQLADPAAVGSNRWRDKRPTTGDERRRVG